uniref:Zinc finger and BTB domain containing 8A n=1 Tax=Neogobius melanostomus TaxID=47308 RepID=A0A8C6TRV3_9GOBI
ITVAHQSNVLKQLDQQRRQELFCDCSVLVEGQLFRAHRNVLFASSGYFRMLLSQGSEGLSDTVNATFDVFSPETFTVIMDFIYSGHLDLTSTNAIEVMSAASYLQMNNVITYCKNFIKSSLDISVKEEESEHCLSLSETCSFTSAPGEDATDTQPQQRGPSVSPPPALWTRDTSRTSFGGKDSDQVLSAIKTEINSPVNDLSAEDPQDPLYRLPGADRRRSKTSKRKAANSSRPNQHNDLNLQGARTQKAEKADELYATLPPIVGVIGQFNKGKLMHTTTPSCDLNAPFALIHISVIHQARKLVCRKCKCPVTEETGHVVCEGTRRYRMCTACIQEVGCDSISMDPLDGACDEPALLLGVDGEEEGDTKAAWMVNDDDDLADDSGADLIIQQVDDSDEELEKSLDAANGKS